MSTTMPIEDVNKLKPGLYRIFWFSGDSSLAAVGMRPNGDRWIAPCNWVTPDEYGASARCMIKRAEPIEEASGDLPAMRALSDHARLELFRNLLAVEQNSHCVTERDVFPALKRMVHRQFGWRLRDTKLLKRVQKAIDRA